MVSAVYRLQYTTGDVRAVGGEGIIGDAPFVPEVYVGGAFRPICRSFLCQHANVRRAPTILSKFIPEHLFFTSSHGFVDNNHGATAVCRALGFPEGGVAWKTDHGKKTKDTRASLCSQRVVLILPTSMNSSLSLGLTLLVIVFLNSL